MGEDRSRKSIFNCFGKCRGIKLSKYAVLFSFDALLLIVVLIFQESLLNYYIIQHSLKHVSVYFWFLVDIAILTLFIVTLHYAYKHLKRNKCRKEKRPVEPLSPFEETFVKLNVRIFGKHYVGILGNLPLSYITWFVYSLFLSVKIIVLCRFNALQIVDIGSTYGPQLLKVCIGASALIFMLLVEAHHDLEQNSPRNNAIKLLVTCTTFEIFDSISFLAMLIVDESDIILSYTLENWVLGLTVCNFMLPTFGLYKLSMSDWGGLEMSGELTAIYKLIHLILINIPYLAIRIYLWATFGQDISIFVMKNVVSIFATLRYIYNDLPHTCRTWGAPRKEKYEVVKMENLNPTDGQTSDEEFCLKDLKRNESV